MASKREKAILEAISNTQEEIHALEKRYAKSKSLKNEDDFGQEMTRLIAGGWNLEDSVSEDLDQENSPERLKRHISKWTCSKMPDFLVRMEMLVESKNDVEVIADLKIRLVHDLDPKEARFVQEEVQSLIKYCENTFNTQLFFLMLEQLFAKFETRYNTINSAKFRTRASPATDKFTYTIGDPSLGTLEWSVGFDPNGIDVKDNIRIKLTDEGRQMAIECNFPEEFIENGVCAEWTPEYHLKNIIKLSTLQMQ